MTDFVICYIEGKRYPRAACHRHHLDPRYTGGSDSPENLVWLCANAHSLVHRASQFVKSGKQGYAQDLSMKAYPSPAMRHRFMAVVRSEVEAAQIAKTEGRGKSEIVMEIPIPVDDYAKLKLLVSDRRIDGKQIPLKEYVQRLILDHVYKHVRR